MKLSSSRSPGWILLAVALGVPSPVVAQACSAGSVARVLVNNESIFADEAAQEGRFSWAFGLANRLHIRTHHRFIRRELLFTEGDCFDAFRLADSERILRAYDFISNVEIAGIRRPDGDWDVRVDTRDEWSTLVEATAEFDDGFELRSISVSEENLLGRGMLIGAFLQQREAQRLSGLRFFTPRLLNSRTDLAISLGNTRAGDFFDQRLVYPFLGEIGRTGFRQSYFVKEDFFQYSVGPDDQTRYVLMPVRSELFEVAVAHRWGEPGDLLVGGIGISDEAMSFPDYAGRTEFIDNGVGFDDGVPVGPETLAVLAPQTRYRAGTRLNLMFAHRAIGFTQRVGLDALQGIQDLEIGTEVSLTLGRSIFSNARNGNPDDLYSRLRIYAAGAPAPFTLLFDGSFEGRQVFSGTGVQEFGWRDMMAEFNLLTYWQPGALESHTFFSRLSAVGGWALDQPFQLTLGGRTGVRGYNEEDFPGSQRVKLTVEDRIYLGWPAPDLFDLGLTLFGDLGRIWDGAVPFGVDSGWKGALGAGLRFGFPTQTRGVVRLDLAWGVDADGFGPPILRISTSDLLGLRGGLRDPQVARSQRVVVGADRFGPIR